MDPRAPDSDGVEVARLGRSHGLEGAMRLHPTGPAGLEALTAADTVWIDGLGDARLDDLRRHGGGWLVRVDRVRRIEAAKQLVHAAVRVDPDALPHDLARRLAPGGPSGRPVLVDGRRYGEVVDTLLDAATPLMRVAGPAGEVWIPIDAPYVSVDDDAVRLQDPPAGLLDPT